MVSAIELPPDIRLDYLAEGAANVVYTVRHADPGVTTAHDTADLHARASATSATTPPPTEIDLEDVQPEDIFQGKLLRLHKDVTWMLSYADLHEPYSQLIEPLFDESQVIFQDLVRLPSDLVEECNSALRAAESKTAQPSTSSRVNHKAPRPPKRHGLYLSKTDGYCLLIEDMSAEPSQGELLVEMKPKWLAQSPNAPAGAKRCRTCALKTMRKAKKEMPQTDSRKVELNINQPTRGEVDDDTMAAPDPVEDLLRPEGYTESTSEPKSTERAPSPTPGPATGHNAIPSFCPLDLVSASPSAAVSGNIQILASAIVHSQHLATHPAIQDASEKALDTLANALAASFHETPLLRRLRDLQTQLDPRGIVSIPTGPGAKGPDEDFLVATTLRDCTLFVRVRGVDKLDAQGIEGLQITMKLGDLDLKAAEEEKMAYWLGIERDLIDGGWYEAKDGKATGCLLERS